MMGKTVSSEENAKLTKWLKTKRHLDVIEFVRYCTALEVDPHEALSLLKVD